MKKLISALTFSIVLGYGMINAAMADFVFGLSMMQGAYYGVGEETTYTSASDSTKTKEAGAFTEANGEVFAEFQTDSGMGIGLAYIIGEVGTPGNTNLRNGDGCGGDCRSGGDTHQVSADFTNHITLYVITPRWNGLYMKAGVVQSDIETNESGMNSSYPDVDTSGIMLGLGFQKDTDAGVFIRLEASAAQYDDVSATSTGHDNDSGSDTANKVEIGDMMSAHGRISIGKAF